MTDFMLHAIAAVLWLVALMSASIFGSIVGKHDEIADAVVTTSFVICIVAAAMAFVLQVIA